MKRLVWLMVLVWVAAAAVPAFAGSAEEIDPAYRTILDLYTEGLSGNEEVILSDSDQFNYSAWQCCIDAGVNPAKSIGYALIDLDGDGVTELIIADATEEQALEGIVFDIWTVRGGEAVNIRRGWERWRLYLTAQDGEGRYGYYQEGSSGYTNESFELGAFRSGEAVTEHTLEFDSERAEQWQLDGAAVNEETAYDTIDTWNAGIIRVVLPYSFAD